MKELIKKTGLTFSSGQKLTSDALNIINNRINELIEHANLEMISNINVNAELGDREYEMEDFLHLIPESRRKPGIKVRFLDKKHKWIECIFLGGDWFEEDNWKLSIDTDIVDGGVW